MVFLFYIFQTSFHSPLISISSGSIFCGFTRKYDNIYFIFDLPLDKINAKKEVKACVCAERTIYNIRTHIIYISFAQITETLFTIVLCFFFIFRWLVFYSFFFLYSLVLLLLLLRPMIFMIYV